MDSKELSFGEYIRLERENCAFGVEEASEMLGVGRSTLYYWETDKKRPNKKNIRKIAKLYGLNVRELVNYAR